jgi:FtsZ-binding cell division protein ZapB
MSDSDKTVCFVGQVVPALDPEQDVRDVKREQLHYTHSRDLELEGLPIHFEHGLDDEFKDKVIGRVVNTWMAQGGHRMMMGEIDTSTPEGKKAAQKVRSGEIGELSLSHASYEFKGKRTEIKTRRPIEVSLTKKGDFPDSRIIHIFDGLSTMSGAPAENTPVAADSSSAPVTVTPVTTTTTTPVQATTNAATSEPAGSPVVDYSNMEPAELLDAARKSGVSAEEYAEISAHLAQALQNAQRNVDALRTKNEQLEAQQAEARRAQISQDLQEYIEIMKNIGVPIDSEFQALASAPDANPKFTHAIFAHSAAAADRIKALEAEKNKLAGKVEKLKTNGKESSLRNHFKSLADRSLSQNYYTQTSSPAQRFSESALQRASEDAEKAQANRYLQIAQQQQQAQAPAQQQQQQMMPPAQMQMPKPTPNFAEFMAQKLAEFQNQTPTYAGNM